MYFRKYRLRKKWLDNCLKSLVSEVPSTGNMENGRKHCCNLNDSAFKIFINHCECSCIGKSLLYDKQNPQAVFFAFLKYILNFKHLPKKGDPHSRCVSGNTDCEKYG